MKVCKSKYRSEELLSRQHFDPSGHSRALREVRKELGAEFAGEIREFNGVIRSIRTNDYADFYPDGAADGA